MKNIPYRNSMNSRSRMLKKEIQDAWIDLIECFKHHKTFSSEFKYSFGFMRQGVRDFVYGVKAFFQVLFALIFLIICIVLFPVLLPLILHLRRKTAKAVEAEKKRLMKAYSPVKRD